MNIEKSEERLQAFIERHYSDAQRYFDLALEMQKSFAERVMISSGAALGVSSTIVASNSTNIDASAFLWPAILFVLSITFSGLGLWLRTLAVLKQSQYYNRAGSALAWRKGEAERQAREGVIGLEPPPPEPNVGEIPEKLMSALDVLVVVASALFIVGLVWACMVLLWTGSTTSI